ENAFPPVESAMTIAVSEELTTKYTSPLTATAAIVARIPLGGTWPRSSYTTPAAAAATVTLPVLNRILDKGVARGVNAFTTADARFTSRPAGVPYRTYAAMVATYATLTALERNR